MSIKKLQQLGGERRKGVEPPPKIKPKDFDDLDIDDDDWGDLENDDFEKQPNYNSGGSGSNNRGRGYDAQFDDFEDAPESDDNEFRASPGSSGNNFRPQQGIGGPNRPQSGVNSMGGTGAFGGNLQRTRPRHPIDDDSEDIDFGTKPTGMARFDDDTPENIEKAPNQPSQDDSDLDGIDFDPRTAVNNAKKHEQDILANEEKARKKQEADKKAAEEAKRNKELEEKRLVEEAAARKAKLAQDEADKRLKEIEERARREKEAREKKEKEELEQIKKNLQERVDQSLSRNKNSSIGQGKDESNGFSDDLNQVLNNINKGQKPDSFKLDDGSSIAKNNAPNNLDDNKSFEEFDAIKDFEDIDDEIEPIKPHLTKNPTGQKSNSNADQLDLLEDLNSRVKSKDERQSANEAIVEDQQDESNAQFGSNEESVEAALDRFLEEEENKKSQSKPMSQNFLNDDSSGPIKKPNIIQKNQASSKKDLTKKPSIAGKKSPPASGRILPSPASKTTPNLNSANKFLPHPSATKHKVTAYEMGRDNEIIQNLRKELDHREEELVKLDAAVKGVSGEKMIADREITELKKKVSLLQADKNALQSQLQLKDQNINELAVEKKILEQDNTAKARLLKDRQELTTKAYVSSAIENQKRVYEAEIQNRDMKIEMLKANLEACEDKLRLQSLPTAQTQTKDGLLPNSQFKPQQSRQHQNTDYFPVQDGTMEELRNKIRELEARLAEKDLFAKRDLIGNNIRAGLGSSTDKDQLLTSSMANAGIGSNAQGLRDHDKAEVLNTLLVKGFQKENERLMHENANLKGVITEIRKGQTGQVVQGATTAELKETIARLQEDLSRKDDYYRQEMEKLRGKIEKVDILEGKIKAGDAEINKLRKAEDQSKEENLTLRMKIKEMERLSKIREEELTNQLIQATNMMQAQAQALARPPIAPSPQLAMTPAVEPSSSDAFKPADFNLTQTNNQVLPSQPNSQLQTKFGNFADPYYYNKSNEARFHPVAKIVAQPAQLDPVRESVLVEDRSRDYELKKGIVKSVLQKLNKGNPYQKANDLIDTALIMFSKKLDRDVGNALQELKSLLVGLDEKLEVDTLEQYVKTAFMQLGDKDDQGLSRTLPDLEKFFVEKMFPFLPEYLNQTKTAKISGYGSVTDLAGVSPELVRLKNDNDQLKMDVACLKEQKKSLEKIIENNPRTARDVDFAILERKLALLEQSQKEKAGEINAGLRSLYQGSKDETAWAKEKEQLVGIIKQKNKEIKGFRQELDTLLKTLATLRGMPHKGPN